jgi:biotin operon repressor
MGRPTFHRQRIRSQAASVQAKSLLSHIAGEVRHRREISPEEAMLVAGDACRFLESGLLGLGLGQIELPCVAGRESHYRRARTAQPEKLARLTVLADEDAGLLEEFGTRTMQQGRLARMIEEAYAQDTLLDGARLCLLMPLTLAAIRERLRPLWEQGALLPLAGMTRRLRRKMVLPRAVLAVDRYLAGEEIGLIRRELAVSRWRWRGWWRAFEEVVAREGADAEALAAILGYPAEWVAGWQEVWTRRREDAGARALVGRPVAGGTADRAAGEEELFVQRLLGEHGYTPAAARQLVQELKDLATRIGGAGRRPGQVVAFGVAADEPPGRSLAEARLAVMVLDYVLPEDWSLVCRASPQRLKWARLRRLTTQAYSQGVALSLPDLAHLLGLSVDAVEATIKKHQDVVLPTRGRVADMGSTLTHAEKVISLYMDGYTETEIKRRTGHSYDSIERYLWDFARVVYLAEREMPLPAIRQALGMSRRVVTRYLELHRRFSHPDYAFRMARVRRMAEAGGPGKGPNTSDWR